MVEIRLTSNKISLLGSGAVKTQLAHRTHKFPLVYAIALQKGKLVKYSEGRFSRIVYIGKSERSGGNGRAYAHLRWMQKVMLLNPDISYFRFIASCDGDVEVGQAKAVEDTLLHRFKSEFGRLPLFNTAGGAKTGGDVKFVDRNLIFRKFGSKTAAECQIIDISGKGV